MTLQEFEKEYCPLIKKVKADSSDVDADIRGFDFQQIDIVNGVRCRCIYTECKLPIDIRDILQKTHEDYSSKYNALYTLSPGEDNPCEVARANYVKKINIFQGEEVADRMANLVSSLW